MINAPLLTFPIAELEERANALATCYRTAQPWPHAVIDNFLPLEVAQKVLYDFPGPDHQIWLDWKYRDISHQPKKQGIGRADRLRNVPPYLLHVMDTFQSYPFLNFLTKLTGIANLLPDPYFYGGGLHQILSGGYLSVHTDFNKLKDLGLYRRINALLYLNPDWKPEYNGHFEMWVEGSTTCEKSVSPQFNRLVVFNTTKRSLHGHPKPLKTPPEVTRKSLAFYYYTAEPESSEYYDNRTDWFDLQTDHS